MFGTVIEDKSFEKITSQPIFEIHNESAMAKALDLVAPLFEYNQIILKAKGDSISKAITVANIITGSILKDKSKVQKVTVDSDPIETMGSFKSTIEIILKISS